MESGTVSYETLGFFIAQVAVVGGMLWKFYSVIQKHFDEKFARLETDIKDVRNDIKEVRGEIKEVRNEIKDVRENMHKIEIKILQIAFYKSDRKDQLPNLDE